MVPETVRKKRFAHINMSVQLAQPVNNTHRGRCNTASCVHSKIMSFLMSNKLNIAYICSSFQSYHLRDRRRSSGSITWYFCRFATSECWVVLHFLVEVQGSRHVVPQCYGRSQPLFHSGDSDTSPEPFVLHLFDLTLQCSRVLHVVRAMSARQ